MLHGLIWMDVVAFVFMMTVFYLLNLLKTGDGVSGRSPDRRVQGEAHSLPGDPRGRRSLAQALGRAHNYISEASSYSGL